MIPAILAQLARALDARGLPYMVIGGQAVLLYGEPRVTRDIDLTLSTGTERLPELLDLCVRAGWRVLVAHPGEFAARHLVLPCEDPATGVRLDFIFGLTPYEQQAIARARIVPMEGVGVRFATPEDLVIHKLIAGRPRDLEDVRGIVHRSGDLDRAYMREWLEQFDRDLDLGTLARWGSLGLGAL